MQEKLLELQQAQCSAQAQHEAHSTAQARQLLELQEVYREKARKCSAWERAYSNLRAQMTAAGSGSSTGGSSAAAGGGAVVGGAPEEAKGGREVAVQPGLQPLADRHLPAGTAHTYPQLGYQQQPQQQPQPQIPMAGHHHLSSQVSCSTIQQQPQHQPQHQPYPPPQPHTQPLAPYSNTSTGAAADTSSSHTLSATRGNGTQQVQRRVTKQQSTTLRHR